MSGVEQQLHRFVEHNERVARRIPDNDKFFAPWKHTLDAGLTLVQLTEAIALDPPDNYLNLRLSSLDAFRPLDTRAPEPAVAETMRAAFFDQMQRDRKSTRL